MTCISPPKESFFVGNERSCREKSSWISWWLRSVASMVLAPPILRAKKGEFYLNDLESVCRICRFDVWKLFRIHLRFLYQKHKQSCFFLHYSYDLLVY